MTTVPDNIAHKKLMEPVDNYLTHRRGFASWALTLDHKRIGVMYLVATIVSFFVGGLFAVLVRTQLLAPNGVLFPYAKGVDFHYYNQFFTLHGAIMIFLVLIPGIPAALGNFILPVMLGAKDVAFPRLNLGSFYLYVLGALFAVLAIVFGGVETGWTFYTPYSIGGQEGKHALAIELMVMGVFILGFSSIFTGMNFIVTIHKLRPPGMAWFRMPLFLWAIYATAILQVLATPVLGITVLLLMMENIMNVGIFNPALGGDPVLFQHFFWFYSHPAVYIMVLPAMGVISEVISTFSRRHIFGYKFIALSSIAIAIISFLVWGHHMFPNGQSELLGTIFSFMTMFVAVPSAVKVWNWLATMYKGSIDLRTPMAYAVVFMFLFTIGGLTGLPLAVLATDVHLHDTYFVVAHFHYVMFGGTLIGFLAGLHFWWPKMTGKMYNETLGRIGAFGVFVGFNLTFFPQFIMGSHGMPRRYATYPTEYYSYHLMSSIGAYVQLASFLLIAGYLVHSLFKGKKAPANPWGGATLEWSCTSPPPHDNFSSPPTVGDPYDHTAIVYDEKTDSFYRDSRLEGQSVHH